MVAAICLVVVLAVAATTAWCLPWLVNRPVHARDEYELRTAVAWRRDLIEDVVDAYGSVVVYGAFVGTWALIGDVWVFRAVISATGLAMAGLLLQMHSVTDRPVRQVPPLARARDTEPTEIEHPWLIRLPGPGKGAR